MCSSGLCGAPCWFFHQCKLASLKQVCLVLCLHAVSAPIADGWVNRRAVHELPIPSWFSPPVALL